MNNIGKVINLNFQIAREQAGKLDGIADALSNLTENEYVAAMEEIRNSWEGETANTFLHKGGVLEGDLNTTIKKIRDVADNIRTITDKVEKAQQAAQAIIAGKNT